VNQNVPQRPQHLPVDLSVDNTSFFGRWFCCAYLNTKAAETMLIWLRQGNQHRI